MSSDISHRIPLTGKGRSLVGKISGGRSRPPANILIPLKRQLIALQLCHWQFLYNETWSGVEPWWMAHWKARAEFLLSVIEILFLSLTVEALQGKMCQDSLPSGVGRSLGAKTSGGKGRPWGIFFGFYKTRHILLSNSANCTMLRAVVLTQYRHVTDRWTDGIAVANTALAMRALRRVVKIV